MPQSQPDHAIVLDGNENQAVAAVRSLARAGYTVAVGAPTSWSKAGWSRGCSRTFVYPSPDVDAAAFVAAVAAEASRVPETLVLPMTEKTTLPLSAGRGALVDAHARFVLPPHDIVARAFDKEATTSLARSLGLDVPRTWTASSVADVQAIAAAVRYPVVVKPRSSQEVIGGATRTTGAPLYAADAEGLIAAWRAIESRCRSALVQEYVEGRGVGYFALMRDGSLVAEFAHRRLRDVRPTGSGSSLRESTCPEPRVKDHAVALLRALGWHGVAMVEFRVRDDGTPVFLEVNGRFWNSLALPIHAGVDFPLLLARMAGGEPVAQPSYRAGVRCRWWLGDVRHLVEVMRGRPAGFPGRYPGRLRSLAAFLRPVRGTFHDNFSLDDPLPELGDWLDFLTRKIPARAATGPTLSHASRRPSHP